MMHPEWSRRLAQDVSLIPNFGIDFEFNRIEQRHVNIVCATVRMFGESRSFWLHNDRAAQRRFGMDLENLMSRCRLISFGAIAESRCLISLGINPINYRIVDLWAEVKQLQNGCDKYSYGRYFDAMGNERCSVPPHPIPSMNKGKDMKPLGTSYAAACALFLGVNISMERKDYCRRIIIEDRQSYTTQEQKEIMDYCENDVEYLLPLYSAIADAELDLLPDEVPEEDLQMHHETRGRQSASMALCEAEGIPLDIEAAMALSSNVDDATDAAISDLVANVYPFFEKVDGAWKQSQRLFADFLKEKGYDKWWPMTTGSETRAPQFQATEEVFDEYDYIPEIRALKDTRKVIGQLKWFRDEAWDEFFRAVDTYDQRLRVWLSPFGTQSNRNAPPASKFIPAMSNWLRCLIRAPKGWAITGVDWSSQEFMIGAALSGDPRMIEAYRSGDPYVAFAKYARAIPQDAVGEWIKDPSLAPADKQEEYKGHESTRGLFKATVLGLQYGMGVAELARKLTSDTGRDVSKTEADKLRTLHKTVFSVYWGWQDKVLLAYKKRPLMLDDGFALFQDNRNGLSVKNFPVQGTGSVMMRRAVILAQEYGLKVLFPLHDAIYLLHEEGDTDAIALLQKCMDEAVTETLGEEYQIRTEAKTFAWNETWIEKKGKKMYSKLSKYLKPRFLLVDEARELEEEKQRVKYLELHTEMKKKKPRKKKVDAQVEKEYINPESDSVVGETTTMET